MSEKKSFAAELRILLLAGLAGVLTTVCCLLGCAAWMSARHLSGSAAVVLAAAAVGVGSFCSGCITALCKREHGLFCGAVQGSIWALVLTAAMLSSGTAPQASGFLRPAAAFLCGCIGGAFGVRVHGKKYSI